MQDLKEIKEKEVQYSSKFRCRECHKVVVVGFPTLSIITPFQISPNVGQRKRQIVTCHSQKLFSESLINVDH